MRLEGSLEKILRSLQEPEVTGGGQGGRENQGPAIIGYAQSYGLHLMANRKPLKGLRQA